MIQRLAAICCLPALCLGAEWFPVAVWYGGGKARAPMLERRAREKKEEWRKDVRQIKALGFNTIRTWIDWASGEPREGEYALENLDVMLELAEEEGLRLFLQVYMDSAPSWVGRKYPDARFVSANGMAIRPESSPGYCLDHAGVRSADLAFYRALAQRVRRSKAFAGWDLWSEPHVINWANPTYIPNPEFCYCPHTQRKFRSWLEKKYGTIDGLNEAWYRRYESWSEVEPSRLSTILSFTDYIDWKRFIADKLGGDLEERYRAVKSVMPDSIVTSHAAGVGLFASPHHWEGQADDWTMASKVDFYGTSFYPKHSAFVDRDATWRGALLDFTRSFGFASGRRGFYVGELQAGFGTIGVNVSREVTPGDLRVWTWSALARGAKGIHFYAWYPMSSGYESGGFGMIHLDGAITERAKAAGEIARVVDRHQALFLAARPVRAQVAVIYNPLAHFVGGRQRAAGYGGPQGEVAGIERDSLLGIYRALWGRSTPIDYVHANDLRVEQLREYKLVYVPYSPMLPSKAAAVLRQYVQGGGTLVAEARVGWNDERGLASPRVPGLGLDEIFGCRETAVEAAEKGRAAIRWKSGALPGLPPGATLAGRWFAETLEPLHGNTEVAGEFENGKPAAVISRYGQGRTLLVGSYLSAAYQAGPSEAGQQFFTGLLAWAGVENRVPVRSGDVEVRLLEAGQDLVLFVLNHSLTETAAELGPLPGGPYTAEDLGGGRQVELEGARLRVRVPAQDAAAIRLSPARR
ncbi:MAG: beta-galactosidase [Bryobacteraceae bacterium]|nr:beta-galactosidase [Bryobacteraceae bacterium]